MTVDRNTQPFHAVPYGRGGAIVHGQYAQYGHVSTHPTLAEAVKVAAVRNAQAATDPVLWAARVAAIGRELVRGHA